MEIEPTINEENLVSLMSQRALVGEGIVSTKLLNVACPKEAQGDRRTDST